MKRSFAWTWKSLDNIANNGITDSNPRIYATRADKKYTLYRKDVFYSGSVYNLRDTAENTHVKDANTAITASCDIPCHCEMKHTVNSLESVNPVVVTKSKRTKVFRKVLDILSEMTNFTLFADPLFLMYAISCTLTMFGECLSTLVLICTNQYCG